MTAVNLSNARSATIDRELPAPPHQLVWDLAEAVIASRALHVVAGLGVADALGPDPMSAAALAERCNSDADALGRVLTLLCAHGIFRREGTSFAHNDASELLRADHPASMRGFARLNGLPIVWNSLQALEATVRSGTSGAELAHSQGLFAYLARHPDEAATFGEAMAGKARADIVDVLSTYDFGGVATIADIGGGRGDLLHAVLDAAPQASGVLFELPQVIASIEDLSSSRLRLQAGDFFHDPLPEADLYLLMEIVHDWPDDEATSILSAVRRAAPAGAVVLVLEHLAPDEGVDRISATLDVQMLAVTGGRERSATDLSGLLRDAGFATRSVAPTPGPISIVEAVAV